MSEGDDLLLDLPSHHHDPQLAFIHSQSSHIPQHITRLFEQYRQNLMADVSQQNSVYLLRLHQYYDGIIVQLKNKIQVLEGQLAKSQQQLLQKRPDLQLLPSSPLLHPYAKEENHSPVTIDFRLEDQEESLLEDIEIEHKPKPTPKLVQSIIFDTLDEAHTVKKQERRTSLQKSIKPSRFLRVQSDEIIAQPVKDMKEGPFQSELKVIKKEMGILRQSLIREGILQEQIGHEELVPKQICIQLLEIEGSRHVKEHLTNQNNQLRKKAGLYRQQLSCVTPELQALKQLLIAALEE